MQENKDEQEVDETRAGEPEEGRGRAATAESSKEEEEPETASLASKYRLILVAAQRSKQLQKGTRPRVDLEDTRDGLRMGTPDNSREIKALNKPSSIGIEKIRSAVKDASQGEDK